MHNERVAINTLVKMVQDALVNQTLFMATGYRKKNLNPIFYTKLIFYYYLLSCICITPWTGVNCDQSNEMN